MTNYKRSLILDPYSNKSFFLWGPRQAGKSTLLRSLFPNAQYIDLLLNDTLLKYLTSPWLLREELQALKEHHKIVIIDEIQKAPLLLNEVQNLIETRGLRFGLCGSSARKLKRGHANLLGGRAMRYEMYGLSAHEVGADFNLTKLLNCGYLPAHYLEKDEIAFRRIMQSYVVDYLKEEIAGESLVRNLTYFSDFLKIAAFSDAEIVNYSTIARDVGVSSNTIKEYFAILVDTLQGHWLKPYAKKSKRKTVASPKFYFSDIGVVNHLGGRYNIAEKSPEFGKAFENWVHHELNLYNEYCSRFLELSYWRLSSGGEVDFIIGDMECAIEAKATARANSDHLGGLRELKKDFPHIQNLFLVSLDSEKRRTDDGITILPYKNFVNELWQGKLF